MLIGTFNNTRSLRRPICVYRAPFLNGAPFALPSGCLRWGFLDDCKQFCMLIITVYISSARVLLLLHLSRSCRCPQQTARCCSVPAHLPTACTFILFCRCCKHFSALSAGLFEAHPPPPTHTHITHSLHSHHVIAVCRPRRVRLHLMRISRLRDSGILLEAGRRGARRGRVCAAAGAGAM